MANRNKSPETFQSLQRRNFAVEVLQSYEKLSWYSYERCESLFQTRLHFQNIVAGLDRFEDALVDWKLDLTPRNKPADKNKSRKSKDRHSSGSASKAKGQPNTEEDATKANVGESKQPAQPGSTAKTRQSDEAIEID